MLRRTWLLLLVAVVVRVPFAWAVTQREGFNWQWGGELFSVANAIAEGQGFASPYFLATGPTAQQTPAFPYLVAALSKLLGGMEIAVRGVLVLNVAFSALTSLALFAIGKKLSGDGWPFAWGWALLPLLGWTEASYTWSTAAYTLALAWLAYAMLQLPRRVLLAGAFFGASLLLDPAHNVAVLVVVLGLALAGRITARQAAGFALTAAAVVAPWIVRNTVALGGPTFLRSNVGYELRRGLLTDPNDTETVVALNPGRSPDELARYVQLGERTYMAEQMRIVREMVASKPTLLPQRMAQRFVAYWIGNEEVVYSPWPVPMPAKHALFALLPVAALGGVVSFWRSNRTAAFVFTALLVVYPLPYYVALTMPRYRAPIEPALVLFAVYCLRRGTPAKEPGTLAGITIREGIGPRASTQRPPRSARCPRRCTGRLLLQAPGLCPSCHQKRELLWALAATAAAPEPDDRGSPLRGRCPASRASRPHRCSGA